MYVTQRQEAPCSGERVGNGCHIGYRLPDLLLADDEPASNGAPTLLVKLQSRLVPGIELQRIRMTRRGCDTIKDDVCSGIEADLVPAAKRQPVLRPRGCQEAVSIVRVRLSRHQAGKPQNDGLVRAVPPASPCERPEQRHVDAARFRQIPLHGESGHEVKSSLHRAARVGRRRADSNLEQLKETDHGWGVARASQGSKPPHAPASLAPRDGSGDHPSIMQCSWES